MAKFSKRHYQAVASILLEVKAEMASWDGHGGISNTYALKSVAQKLSDLFAEDNERFDREHFLAVVRGERAVNSRPPKE